MLCSTLDMVASSGGCQVFGLPVALPSSLSGAPASSPGAGARALADGGFTRARGVVGRRPGRSFLGIARVRLIEGLHAVYVPGPRRD